MRLANPPQRDSSSRCYCPPGMAGCTAVLSPMVWRVIVALCGVLLTATPSPRKAMTTRQMGLMMLGALVGVVVGTLGLLAVFRQWGERIQDNGVLMLALVMGFVVGGLVGGAYGMQAILYRIDRARKKQRKEKGSGKNKRRR